MKVGKVTDAGNFSSHVGGAGLPVCLQLRTLSFPLRCSSTPATMATPSTTTSCWSSWPPPPRWTCVFPPCARPRPTTTSPEAWSVWPAAGAWPATTVRPPVPRLVTCCCEDRWSLKRDVFVCCSSWHPRPAAAGRPPSAEQRWLPSFLGQQDQQPDDLRRGLRSLLLHGGCRAEQKDRLFTCCSNSWNERVVFPGRLWRSSGLSEGRHLDLGRYRVLGKWNLHPHDARRVRPCHRAPRLDGPDHRCQLSMSERTTFCFHLIINKIQILWNHLSLCSVSLYRAVSMLVELSIDLNQSLWLCPVFSTQLCLHWSISMFVACLLPCSYVVLVVLMIF